MSVKYGKLLNNAAATNGYTAIAVGRVMTCVLGMVVNREREIRNFKETPFTALQEILPMPTLKQNGKQSKAPPIMNHQSCIKKMDSKNAWMHKP